VQIPYKVASSIMMPPEFIVYRAVSDRIARLPCPQRIVSFYYRVMEAQLAISKLGEIGAEAEPLGPTVHVATIAEILITACQLANGIITNAPYADLDAQITATTLKDIRDALDKAKVAFPDAESFQQ